MSIGRDSKSHTDGGETRVYLTVLNALQQHDDFDVESWDSTLYDYIEPDALENIFAHNDDAIKSITFEIEDATITLWQDNRVHAQVE